LRVNREKSRSLQVVWESAGIIRAAGPWESAGRRPPEPEEIQIIFHFSQSKRWAFGRARRVGFFCAWKTFSYIEELHTGGRTPRISLFFFGFPDCRLGCRSDRHRKEESTYGDMMSAASVRWRNWGCKMPKNVPGDCAKLHSLGPQSSAADSVASGHLPRIFASPGMPTRGLSEARRRSRSFILNYNLWE